MREDSRAPRLRVRAGELVPVGVERRRAWLFCGGGILWFAVFVAGPLAAILAMGFSSRGDYGEIQWKWSLDSYRRLGGFGELGFDPVYPLILFRTLWVALATTLGCVVCGLPFAFFIAGLKGRLRTAALMGVMVPFWTNLLIRTYAWQILMAPQGPLTVVARPFLGLGEGDALYPGLFAVFLCLVCDFIPFMVLPLYASVEKVDWALADAARDLGATEARVFWHAVLPQIRPGLAAGALLVFLPALGQFVIPDLLGGARTVLLGNLVQQQFVQGRDWPFGAAIASVCLALVAVGLVFLGRMQAVGDATQRRAELGERVGGWVG